MKRLDRATIKHAQTDPTELGFLTDFAAWRPDVAAILGATACPLIFVRGNHEDHAFLDELERAASEPIFPVDAYQRIFCLKTGAPCSASGAWASRRSRKPSRSIFSRTSPRGCTVWIPADPTSCLRTTSRSMRRAAEEWRRSG